MKKLLIIGTVMYGLSTFTADSDPRFTPPTQAWGDDNDNLTIEEHVAQCYMLMNQQLSPQKDIDDVLRITAALKEHELCIEQDPCHHNPNVRDSVKILSDQISAWQAFSDYLERYHEQGGNMTAARYDQLILPACDTVNELSNAPLGLVKLMQMCRISLDAGHNHDLRALSPEQRLIAIQERADALRKTVEGTRDRKHLRRAIADNESQVNSILREKYLALAGRAAKQNHQPDNQTVATMERMFPDYQGSFEKLARIYEFMILDRKTTYQKDINSLEATTRKHNIDLPDREIDLIKQYQEGLTEKHAIDAVRQYLKHEEGQDLTPRKAISPVPPSKIKTDVSIAASPATRRILERFNADQQELVHSEYLETYRKHAQNNTELRQKIAELEAKLAQTAEHNEQHSTGGRGLIETLHNCHLQQPTTCTDCDPTSPDEYKRDIAVLKSNLSMLEKRLERNAAYLAKSHLDQRVSEIEGTRKKEERQARKDAQRQKRQEEQKKYAQNSIEFAKQRRSSIVSSSVNNNLSGLPVLSPGQRSQEEYYRKLNEEHQLRHEGSILRKKYGEDELEQMFKELDAAKEHRKKQSKKKMPRPSGKAVRAAASLGIGDDDFLLAPPKELNPITHYDRPPSAVFDQSFVNSPPSNVSYASAPEKKAPAATTASSSGSSDSDKNTNHSTNTRYSTLESLYGPKSEATATPHPPKKTKKKRGQSLIVDDYRYNKRKIEV